MVATPISQSLVGSLTRMTNAAATGTRSTVHVSAPGRISRRRCCALGESDVDHRWATMCRAVYPWPRSHPSMRRRCAGPSSYAPELTLPTRSRSRGLMPTRRKTDRKAPPPPEDEELESTDEVEDEPEAEAAAEPDLDSDAVVEIEAEEEEEDEEEEPIEEEEEELEQDDEDVVQPVVAVRPAPRPTPGRPPSAKEEPEPPFSIGERVVLVRNTRPRTGTPIGDHPVGAVGRVETVLSQTAIIRFDRAPDTKEVV